MVLPTAQLMPSVSYSNGTDGGVTCYTLFLSGQSRKQHIRQCLYAIQRMPQTYMKAFDIDSVVGTENQAMQFLSV